MSSVYRRYEVELHCPRCQRTTTHVITLGEGALSRSLCVACGRALAVDTLQFMEQYMGSVVRRLLAKPFDIRTEFLRAPREFIASLPGRMLTKPFRVAAELRSTIDIVRLRHQPSETAAPVIPPVAGELPTVERCCTVLLSGPMLWSHTSEEILAIAYELGYDGVELWMYQLLRDEADLPAVAAQARALGLTVTVHALSWDLNPTSRIASVARASQDALAQSVEVAATLGAHLLVMHPGHTSAPYDDSPAYWPALIASVQQVADLAERHRLQVGVEHMEASQTEYFITPEDTNRLLREVNRPNVGTVFDIAHIPWGEDEVRFVQRLERIVHVHLSDADKSHLHLPLGQGTRDLVRVLGALASYQGSVAIEGFSISAGGDLARWNKAQFEELWREAGNRRLEPTGAASSQRKSVYPESNRTTSAGRSAT